MRAKCVSAIPNEDGRTIDMTVLFSTDLNVPIETRVLLIVADGATQQMALDRMEDETVKMIAAKDPMPTQQQVNDLVVGLEQIVAEP